MIIIRSSRQDAETILRNFFPAMNLYKTTRLANLAHLDLMSEQYLSAVVVNSILTEIEQLFQKKLVTTSSKAVSFKFTEAQAVVLYKSLMALPVDSDKIYYNKIRNLWVSELDQVLISTGFYHRAAGLQGVL